MPIPAVPLESRSGDETAKASDVIACIDRAEQAAWLLPHARALAAALGRPITLLQVLEVEEPKVARPDPIEWDLRRHEARRALGDSIDRTDAFSPRPSIALAEGRAADAICRYSRAQADGLVVMGSSCQPGRRRRIGATTQDVILHAPGPVLLVPSEASPPPARYQRILVPLDGSGWAESVLTVATRLARTADAEIVLAHVVPRPELTEIHPLEAEEIALQCLLVERNERAARNYLEGIRSRLAAMGLRVRVLSERAEDVRTGLGALINREHADLVVLSARGQGSKRHGDLPYGSVSAYLMTHSAAPLLVLQSGQANGDPDPIGAGLHEDVRLPRASQA